HKTRTCTFCRAGHNGLIIQKTEKKGIDCLVPEGIGLGLDPGTVFNQTLEEEQIQLQPGDRLLLYTDGAFEARNQAKKEFGEERLLHLFRDSTAPDSASINEEILSHIAEFTLNAVPHDDITLVTVRILH
ncbi:MAG: PP2C family protein-serine/threonine phosphatase, partial [bacterium]